MPRGLTADQKAALATRVKGLAHFVRLTLPGADVFLWTGLGDADALGNTWSGVGEVLEISGLSTSSALRAQSIAVTLSDIPGAMLPQGAIAASRAVWYQGQQLTIYLGLTDLYTGLPIGNPTAVWSGFADVMTFQIGQSVSVTLTGEHLDSHMRRTNGLRMTTESHNARLGNPVPRDLFFDVQSGIMGAPRGAFG